MKITFKNVGQGDTILLEWRKEERLHLGIIDCNRYQERNPLLEHLKFIDEPYEIFFMVLSHPHIDHYSGFLEVLEYVQHQHKAIKYFFHSSSVDPSYLNWVELSTRSKRMLDKLYSKIIQLDALNIIKYIRCSTHGLGLKLNDDYGLKWLSPSDTENRLFSKNLSAYRDKQKIKCSQAANLLSSIIKLVDIRHNNFILLTSDAERSSFDRLSKGYSDSFGNERLLLGQVPHHGAENNHFPLFWQKVSLSKEPLAIISAGPHYLYKHPSAQVITDFTRLGFKVYITNGNTAYNLLKADKKSTLNLGIFESNLFDRSVLSPTSESDISFEMSKGEVKDIEEL